ncbi:MAG TPA: efflux RND transporter permease subunit [Fimbriimonadaceae bacterium]|nr:efflux RND transporter permease subunit [Fimbriimonadaceae bacterium]
MNIGKFSVTRPVAVTMRIAALVLLGYICLLRLPVDLLPRIEIPTVAVSVSWPNTPPETMEAQITRPLEQAVSSVQGLYMVSSTSSLGSCFVRAQLNYGVNVDQATLDVIQQVQRAVRRFPNDPTITPPSVFKFDPNSLPILSYGVTGDPDLIHLNDIMTNQISPILESANGVAQVNISGGYTRSIIVDVDPVKLQAYGLAMSDISKRFAQENISLPAGFAKEGHTQYTIRAVGYFHSVDQIRHLPLGSFNGHLVDLSQVATVRDATQDILYYVRMNGKDAVNVSITKQTDANTVDTAKNVQEKLDEIKRSYPNLVFRPVYDQSKFVTASITDLQQTAIIGGVLAIVIITFFLRNLRSTFVVALSIPISIISTFALIYFCGFTLNTISLSGLALASGLIVDDAIVVLENIYRHIERDKKRAADAAVSGTTEIIPAVMASTFTVMIVFLPLLLIKGQTGQTFTQFSLVVVFSLAISLLDATTVVPMLCSRMIREKDVIEEAHPELRAQYGDKSTLMTRIFDAIGRWFHNFDNSYRRSLDWAIHHRTIIIGVAGLAIVAAGVLFPFVGRENLPKTDTGNFNVNVKLPIGTALETTDAAMRQLEGILARDPDVDTYIVGSGTNVGLRGAGGGGVPNQGGATVQLKANRKSSTDEVVKRIQRQASRIAGARININPFDIVANIIGGNNFGVSVDVYGQDLDQLTKTSREVMDALDKVPGLEAVDTSVQDSAPEIQWTIDRDKAQTLGVSFEDIASTLGAATSGQLSTNYQDPNGYQYPIYVQVPQSKRLTIDQLKDLPVEGTANRPSPVLLKQVAIPTIGAGPNQIQRQNRQRYINVGGRVSDRPQSEVEADITKALQNVHFPQGSYWTFSAQLLQSQKEYSGLGLSVFLAVALIYMLLATQFESFIYPLIVLCSVPLCAIGLVLALFLTGRSFGLTAFIGLLMLIGIVVKNGILLVDYTNQLRSRGVPRDEAILTAAPTRLRPILMTTLAAILGMMPLALGIGTGSEMYVPLATSVIGGLATSTMLTLFIVPTVYTLFDDLSRRIRKDPRDLERPGNLIEPSIASTGSAATTEVHE